MARKKKTRKISDIMPARKSDKSTNFPKNRKQLTRFELDAQAREAKKQRKHKGHSAGARNGALEKKTQTNPTVKTDPRLGSRKKIALIPQEIVIGKNFKISENIPASPKPQPTEADWQKELSQLENNTCLNNLLDAMESGKTLSKDDQRFVDECLARIDELMSLLGIEDEYEDDDNGDELYRQFAQIDINQFK